jgi:hypothetical protein
MDNVNEQDSDQYITQDMNWNSVNSVFDLVLHTQILSDSNVNDINRLFSFESSGNAEIGTAQTADKCVIVHCKCKEGLPTDRIDLRFDSGTALRVAWPGVTRVYVRIRIMSSTSLPTMMDMLEDDIENRYSVSDVEYPEQNQSFRPWSDDDDSENEAV